MTEINAHRTALHRDFGAQPVVHHQVVRAEQAGKVVRVLLSMRDGRDVSALQGGEVEIGAVLEAWPICLMIACVGPQERAILVEDGLRLITTVAPVGGRGRRVVGSVRHARLSAGRPTNKGVVGETAQAVDEIFGGHAFACRWRHALGPIDEGRASSAAPSA